jgi:CBS-domain-containing membrane protein
MFFNIFPEAFLAQLNDKDTVLEFLKRPHAAHTAGDIMQPPEFVHLDDTILRAFQVLQKRRLEGIPVVDRHNRVRGYIHLLELMEVCTREAPAGRGAP